MPLLNNFIQISDAPPPSCTCCNDPESRHAHAINGFHGSGAPNYFKHTISLNHDFEVGRMTNINKHLRHTNGPIHQSCLNIVVDDIGDITWKPGVGMHMVTNTSAPQVANPSPSSPKAPRLEKSIEGESKFDHAPINQYLWHPRPPIPKVDVGPRPIIVATSMNRFRPPIEN